MLLRLCSAGARPASGVERPAGESSLDFLTHAEVVRLLATAEAASRLQHVAVALAVHMGLRKGELFGLRWQHLGEEMDRVKF